MLSRSFPLALLLSLALVVGGCGSKEEATTGSGGGAAAVTLPTAPVADDLGLLVPADADVLMYVADLDGMMHKVQNAIAIFDKDMASEADLSEMRAQLPFGELLDATKPIALAMKMPAEGEPVPVMIASVTDVPAVQKMITDQGQPELATSGSYIAMLMGRGDPVTKADKPSALVTGMPKGDLVIRANLASLRDTFADQIDGAFGEMNRNLPEGGPFDIAKVMDSMAKGMKTFLDSTEGMDLVLDVDEGLVNIKGVMSVKAGSPLDGMAKGTADVSGLANRLPAGFPVAMLFSGDMDDMPDWLEEMVKELIEAYPEDLQKLMKSGLAKQAEYSGIMGNLHGAVFKIDEGGMAFSAISKVEDTDKYFKAWEDNYQDKEMTETLAALGMEIQMLPPTTVAGVEVRHQRMAMDFEKLMQRFAPGEEMPPEILEIANGAIGKLFGEDGVVIHTAAVDGYVITVMGGGEAMIESAVNAAKGTDTMKAALASAINAAGGAPSGFIYLDGRAIAKGVLGFMTNVMPDDQAGGVPVVPDGDPVPLVFYGGADGRFYMGGMAVDLQSIKNLIDDFMK